MAGPGATRRELGELRAPDLHRDLPGRRQPDPDRRVRSHDHLRRGRHLPGQDAAAADHRDRREHPVRGDRHRRHVLPRSRVGADRHDPHRRQRDAVRARGVLGHRHTGQRDARPRRRPAAVGRVDHPERPGDRAGDGDAPAQPAGPELRGLREQREPSLHLDGRQRGDLHGLPLHDHERGPQLLGRPGAPCPHLALHGSHAVRLHALLAGQGHQRRRDLILEQHAPAGPDRERRRQPRLLRGDTVTTVRARVAKALSWALLIGVVTAGAALILVPKATGARPLTVLSGSMEPTYDIGSVVVVRPVDTDELAIGDVITFQPVSDDPRLTTHRIDGFAFGAEGKQFVTKGDNNDTVDLEPVSADQVRGEVWYSVPLVGYVSVWLAGGWVRTAINLFAVALLLYGGVLLAGGLVERRRREKVPA
ncbi:signal peptidase I [Nocardioides euryhalodurans]|uniref:Signal peptidase I n=1 Tax=Nocardioides euryhalodurans TaxID=2518370 RepID=A0A4P7GJK6_9ACTN|nr:signal peptidase I [Nocardioides euryhalodurans]